jgi:hypothetical protein
MRSGKNELAHHLSSTLLFSPQGRAGKQMMAPPLSFVNNAFVFVNTYLVSIGNISGM